MGTIAERLNIPTLHYNNFLLACLQAGVHVTLREDD